MPPRSPKLAALTSAALIAVLAAACSSGSTSPGHESSPSSSTTVIGSSTTPAGANNSPYQWTRQADPALALGGGPTASISGVLTPSQGSQTWTLTGSREMADGATVATVWSSTTTSTWTATSLASPSTTSQAASAASWRTSTVVVGSVGSGGKQRAAAWVSQTGGPFVAVPVVPPVPAPSSMQTVTASSLGMFAIGTVGGKPALWSSTNGLRWTLSNQFGDLTADSVDPVVDTVLATNGSVYAAGSVANGTETDAALWASGDGINWRRVSEAQAAFGGPGRRVITGLASFGTGLVAVGGVRTGPNSSPASWISPDGVSWSQPSEDFPMDARPQPDTGGAIVRGVSSVATLPGTTSELMAVGGGSSAQRLWQSNNGVSWSEVPLPAGAATSADWRATTVGTTGTSAVVTDSEPGRPYVLTYGPGGWGEPSSNSSVFGPVQTVARPVDLASTAGGLTMAVDLSTPPQSLGGRTVERTVYVSFDGSTWTTAPTANAALGPPSLPPGASAAIRFGDEWVAVGQAGYSSATSAASANPSGLAESWTSVDGIHWVAHGPLDATTDITPEKPAGLCVRPGPQPAVVAVGSAYQSSVAWVSADGAHWIRATIDAPPLAGGSQQMTGCIATASGLVAYGGTTSPSGARIPATWRSVAGAQWTRENSAGFLPGATSTLTAVADSGSTWLALTPGTANPADPAIGQLWLSLDGTLTWLPIDTAESPWPSTGTGRLDLAAFEDGLPLVVGTEAGQLAAWIGSSPSQPSSSAPST